MTHRTSRTEPNRVRADRLWLELRKNRRTGLDVGYKERGPSYQLVRDDHDFWELLYVDKGYVQLCLDQSPLHVAQGEFVLIAPGQSHSVIPSTVAPFYITAHFQTNLTALDRLKGTVSRVDNEDRRLLKGLLVESQEDRFGSRALVCSYLLEFLIRALRHGEEWLGKRHGLPTYFQEHQREKTVHETICFLEKNLSRPLTLREVARALGVSPSHLEHIFKKETGKPVMSYLQDLRLEQAKRLLLESTLNVTQIAECCGYSSIYLFSRRFKQLVSVSPSEYAKMLRSNGLRGPQNRPFRGVFSGKPQSVRL